MQANCIIRIAVGAALTVIASASHGADKERVIVIGTGGPTGVYFVVGNAICRMIHKKKARGRKHKLRCVAPNTRGSIYNLEKVGDRKIQFGIAQSDWHHHAVKGTSKFEGEPISHLRSVFSLHLEPMQIVVSKKSGIKSWSDLKGKRVNIGHLKSGHRATMEVLLQAHGRDNSYFKEATNHPPSVQARILCKGGIDAFAYTVGVPNASVAQATDGCGASIIELQDDVVKKLIAKHKFYSKAIIPKNTYATRLRKVETIAVIATLVTSADVHHDTVYELTRAVFKNLADICKLHPALKSLDPKKMVENGLTAPLHEGAMSYYKEAGLMKEDGLMRKKLPDLVTCAKAAR